ncbi:TPA: TrbM/KikA/MpfK family conjugal transfer protein [Salmonella enterica subsp. enterica serovar Anatum var. 15+]
MNKKVFVVNFICIHLQSVYPALIMYAWFIMNWGVKMKFYFVAVVMFFFVVNSAYAEKNKVDPNDPCDVYFCMAGMVCGNKSECQPAIKKFFSIQSFKKHHRFNPSKTFRERSKFLGQCSTADPAHVSKIMSKFGRMKG